MKSKIIQENLEDEEIKKNNCRCHTIDQKSSSSPCMWKLQDGSIQDHGDGVSFNQKKSCSLYILENFIWKRNKLRQKIDALEEEEDFLKFIE